MTTMTHNEELERLCKEKANGFETWDSFYSGLSIQEEMEGDITKKYTEYLVDYIKDAISDASTSYANSRIQEFVREVEGMKKYVFIPPLDYENNNPIYLRLKQIEEYKNEIHNQTIDAIVALSQKYISKEGNK